MNKHNRFLFAALAGLFLFYFGANAQCTGNLLTNPGFESGLTGWTTVGNVSITTDAHSGTKAATVSGSGFASIGQALPATVGTSYTVKVWSKGNFIFELRFMNASWVKIPGGNSYGFQSTNYQQNSITATAPPGAVYVYWLASKDLSNGFTVDDACLVSGSGGPTCAITPTVSNIVCSNNNTPNNPNDDTYSFNVNATNPAGGAGYQLFIPQLSATYNGTYGSPLYIQYVAISTGNLTLNFTDNITANCSATATVTAPPPCSVTGLPDLLGYVHEIIPGTNNCFTAPGQPFAVMLMQINNNGDVAATAFKVKFYFSTDNMLSANDVLWSTVNLPSLNVLNNGGPAFIGPGQPVPASLANGQYYVIVIIDTDSQVAESNEANNLINPFTVQIGAPDIILDSYSGLPATVAAGSSFPLQVTVKYLANGFTLPANTSFPVNVYISDLSPNIALGTVNYTLADFSQSNTVTKTVQVTVPPSVPTGSHTIRMYANTSFCEDVYLSNYKDQSVTVTTGGGNGIDLELSLAQNTANPVIYSNYTTTLTLVNKGPQAATGVKVKWLKPAGVVYTGGNEFVASQGSFNPNSDQIWTVGSVPANGTATLKVSYFLLQNGAPITYAQVTAADQTDVDSQPNNGTPPTVNEDDEASTGGSQPPVLTPDLTISNLVIYNEPGTPGQVLAYNFDMANIGNGNAPQDFIVRAWISTSPTFNTNGIQDGIVPTGNFIAGFSVAEVPGASMLPSTLTSGLYYLHLWLDADGQVTESNENNNTVSVPFLVQAAAGPGVCDDLIGVGAMNCLAQAANGNLEVHYANSSGFRKATLDGMGQVINDQAGSVPPVYPSYGISNGNFVKTLGAAIVYSQPIPASLTSQYDYILGFTEFNNDYIVFGYKNADANVYIIRTNASFAIQQSLQFGGFGPIYYLSVGYPQQIAPNQFAFMLRSGGMPSMETRLFIADGNLNVLSGEQVQGPNFSGSASLGRNSCGQYTVNSSYANYAHRGSWYGSTYRDGHFENGFFISDYLFDTYEQTSMGYGTHGYTWVTLLVDGSKLRGSYIQQLPSYLFPATNIVKLEKTLGSTVIWEKYVKLSNAASVRRLAVSGSEIVFLSEKNNAVFVEALSCLEVPNPKPDLAIFGASINPNSVQAGNFIYTSLTLYNLGLGSANGATLRYLLSADNVYSANDIVLANEGAVNVTSGDHTSFYPQVTIPSTVASGNYYLLMVADPGNTVAEANENNNTVYFPLTVTGGSTGQPDCNAISITTATSSLIIANAIAPHVLIKLFNPNWTLNFQCLDNCANPLTINNLTAGNYHLQIKLLDAGWGEICYLERDVNVSSFGAGGGTGIARSDDRQRLVLDRLYPSPTSYQVTVDVFSPIAQATTLDFYDQMGRPVHSMKVQLDKGNNPVQVLVFNWKSGTYNVIARGEETGLPAYGRFLKVWEE